MANLRINLWLCFLTVAPYAIRTRDKESLFVLVFPRFVRDQGIKAKKRRNPNLLF